MPIKLILVAAAVLALLLFWSVGASRRLRRLRATVRAAFSPLDRVLQQQLDWVGAELQEDPAGSAPDLELCQRTHAASRQVALVLASLRNCPSDPRAMDSVGCARLALQAALAALHSVPLAQLPPEWTRLLQQEEAVAVLFNDAVARYNAAVRQFPAVLLALSLGWRRARPFAVLQGKA